MNKITTRLVTGCFHFKWIGSCFLLCFSTPHDLTCLLFQDEEGLLNDSYSNEEEEEDDEEKNDDDTKHDENAQSSVADAIVNHFIQVSTKLPSGMV